MRSIFPLSRFQRNLIFRDTKLCAKHKKTSEFHLYCWVHVCYENEWWLVDCFHRESRGFSSSWAFFDEHSRITGLQGKGEGIPLTPHYHFHPLHRHLDISRAITAGSSLLHIASSRTRTGNL